MCDCTNTKQPERKPHVHADVIKAWADGVKVGDVWCVDSEMKVVRRIQPNPSYVGGRLLHSRTLDSHLE